MNHLPSLLDYNIKVKVLMYKVTNVFPLYCNKITFFKFRSKITTKPCTFLKYLINLILRTRPI